jgi:hypothetical protein
MPFHYGCYAIAIMPLTFSFADYFISLSLFTLSGRFRFAAAASRTARYCPDSQFSRRWR